VLCSDQIAHSKLPWRNTILKIRNEQMEVFEQAAARNFEDRMIKHLEQSFPRHCDVLGETKIRDIIRYGWDRAKSYGLTSERGVRLYISLMFMLGSGFDADPQLPWAAEILNDRAIQDQTERTDRLYNKAMDYLNRVAGLGNQHIDEALRKIHQQGIAALSQSAAREFVNYMVMQLNQIFPQKYEYLGEDRARHLILLGIKSAKGYGITTEHGFAIYIVLMFMLGSGVDADPQFAWIAAILKDEAITDETQRVYQLYEQAMAYLEKWLT
jgi:hypothetical protein